MYPLMAQVIVPRLIYYGYIFGFLQQLNSAFEAKRSEYSPDKGVMTK